jgi:hypothetical protein
MAFGPSFGLCVVPVPLVVMAVEEAAANEGVAPKAVWRNVARLARLLAVHRQGLWG